VKEIVDIGSNGGSIGEEGCATAIYSFVGETAVELPFNKVRSFLITIRISASLLTFEQFSELHLAIYLRLIFSAFWKFGLQPRCN
jgi:hypothetical protein